MAETISSKFEVLDNSRREALITAVCKKSFPVLLYIDSLKTQLNRFKQPRNQFSRSLYVMETAAVGHQDSATGDFFG